MARAKFSEGLSQAAQLRCIDDCPESEERFGTQLWYFEGLGIDAQEKQHRVYGVVEYSLQYGLHELVEDRVFQSEQQRDQYRRYYQRDSQRKRWHHPANHWLLAGLTCVALSWAAYLLIKSLAA